MFSEAVRLAIMGYHFEKVTSQHIAVHNFRDYLSRELDAFREKLHSWSLPEIHVYVQDLLFAARREYEQIHFDFRHQVEDALENFQRALHSSLATDN